MTQTEVAVASGTIRVMVVDDSAVVRGLISRQLNAEPGMSVVATAPHGELALAELARTGIDVIVLDIEMPVMDGLTALKEIRARFPGVTVIMVSTLTRRGAEITFKALSLGAADCVAKPESGLGSAEEFKRELAAKIRALAPRRRDREPPPVVRPVTPAIPRPTYRPARTRPKLIAIGASTGGPPALMKLFESLRDAVEQPILLTQHMPATFTALLAEQLSRIGNRPCAEARDGERILPGHCYVAPGGWHMVVDRDGATPILRLNQEPPENFCRPAVDPMMRTVARVYGSGVLGIILTGMGADGARGCEALAQAGGRFIVQDEATSVVWGMPGAAAATGLADSILPLNEIGPWVRRITGMTE
ncbi:MAG: protein-glutamate methylesterase/protein-glutamine glutaminase [Brevundimonas sp.]